MIKEATNPCFNDDRREGDDNDDGESTACNKMVVRSVGGGHSRVVSDFPGAGRRGAGHATPPTRRNHTRRPSVLMTPAGRRVDRTTAMSACQTAAF